MSDTREIVDDAGRALGHVREAFPALDAREARPLDDGWASYAYMVDSVWVFRFPRTDQAEHLYRKERLLLPRLAPRLAIAVPDIEHVATLPDGRTFMGRRAIRGKPLTREAIDAMPAAVRDAAAGEIAAFLRAVHAFRVDDAREFGAGDSRARDGYEHLRDAARRDVFPSLSEGERGRCERLFAQFLGDAGNFRYDVCLTHADLWARHVLMDQRPRVVGIIDYGSTCISDPAYDFYPPLFDFGEDFTRRILAEYGHDDPDRVIRKGSFYCAADAVNAWLDGLRDYLNHMAHPVDRASECYSQEIMA